MKQKSFALLALILMLFFSSCIPTKEKIKVGYIPIAECIQLYVAMDLGYFEKYNVEIEIISLAGGAEILNALNSGSVDVGFSNVVSLVLHKSQGSEFYSVFGGTLETQFNQNHALLINKSIESDNVKSILTGSRISVNTFKNIEELMVRKYLRTYGVEWDDVEKIQIPFPRMLPLLESGEITISSIVEPFISIASQNTKGHTMNLANHYLSTTPKTLVATYVSSKRAIDKKKNSLVGFVKAMEDATDFIKNNESEARDIIGNYTKIPEELLPQIGLSEFLKEIDLNQLELVINDMVDFEYISRSDVPEISTFKYNAY
jgi:NitT/TauT family transport system substrate-binding protein